MNIKHLLLTIMFLTTVGYAAPVMATTGNTPVDNVPDAIEFALLKKLYDSLGGQNWTRKTNWPAAGSWPTSATNAQFGTWYGITVENGDIVKIQLSNNKLTGRLPSNMGDLQALKAINLYRNTGITGSIPASLGSISALSEINFSTAHFSGNIPASIFNAALTSFDATANDLTGPIPASVGNATALTVLVLEDNQLSGDIPAAINNLVHLRILNLKTNQLTGSIPASIGLFTALEDLELADNKLTGTLPNTWQNLTNLKILHLHRNSFTGTIPESFGRLINLEQLYLCTNQFSGSIPRSLGNLTKLQYFKLYENQLTGSIPSELGNLTEALQFEVFTNQLSGPIPASIGNLKKLDRLSFQENQLTGTVPPSILNIPNLDIVNLSFNKLTGNIPDFIGQLTTLRSLYLNNNAFAGPIPASLSNLSNLEYLFLNSNQLSGSVPASLSTLSKLKTLHLYNNQLTGTLPANIFLGLTQVTNIDISNNQLTDAFPASIEACTLLTSLRAHQNLFTSIPGSLLGMNALSFIHFSTNELTTIPDFSQHVNKARLTFTASYNRLDFSSLNSLKNAGIKEVQLSPQNNIRDVSSVNPDLGGIFAIVPSRPAPDGTTISWQKQAANGTWSAATNQDNTQKTFRRESFTAADEGSYRWRMTSTVTTGLTLTSEPIVVKRNQGLLPILDDLSYQYRYDERHRVIKTKTPGTDWIYSVYDARDRVVLTQDGNQRAKTVAEWTFIKYDALNRPVLTGVYKDVSKRSQASMQDAVNTFYGNVEGNATPPQGTSWFEKFATIGGVFGYTNGSFPTISGIDAYRTVTYYDQYDFKNVSGTPQGLHYRSSQLPTSGTDKGQPSTALTVANGQITGDRVKNLETGEWLWSATYYDEEYRNIQAVATNHKGGLDITTTVYDFTGKPLRTKTTHTVQGKAARTVTRKFEYDHVGRLIKTWHQSGSNTPVLLVMQEYNELGMMITKRLHSTDPAATADNQRIFKESISYRYNAQGWLTNMIGTDMFSMELNYANPSLKGGPKQYNGNISEMIWQTAGADKQSYGYYYDTLYRLKEARYYNLTNASRSTRFDEKIGGVGLKGYDLNGNILALQRRGQTSETTYAAMDNLKYSYEGNQLVRVDDAIASTPQEKGFQELTKTTGEYDYDLNGNMLFDKNKGITSVEYNHLNLPRKIIKGTDSIVYVYDGLGQKLSQKVYGSTPKVTDYLGEFMYVNDTLKFINHEEGRLIPGSPDEYQYHIKDHLGNVRATFAVKGESETSLATMEDSNAAVEEGQFLNYEEAVTVNVPCFDHTNPNITGVPNPQATYRSTRLLGGNTNAIYGLAKSLSVLPGDKVSAEVFVKYVDLSPSGNTEDWLATTLQYLEQGSSAVPYTLVDGGVAGSIGGSIFPYINLLKRQNDIGTAPKVYLNWLYFDRDFNYLDGGFERVTTYAQEIGHCVQHERLAINESDISITVPGYLYIYLSNENETRIEAFFDDFKVTHVKTPVIQSDDYYPFGQTFNSERRERGVSQNFKYNGIENEDELGLNINTTFFRIHDPLLGRWWQTDPKPREDISPYAAMGNNPLLYSDVMGDTTIIYSTLGKKLEQINDTHENQIHFMSATDYAKLAKSRAKGESNNSYGSRARNSSTAFIGSNTIREMRAIVKESGRLRKEINFVGRITATREIHLEQLPLDATSKFDESYTQGQIDKKYSHEEQEKLFLWGHVHHKALLEGKSLTEAQKEFRLGTPSNTTQPYDYYKRLRNASGLVRHSPALLATPYGMSIYPTIGLGLDDYPRSEDLSRVRYSFFKAGKVK